ncbi:MAG: hypothetical protein ABIH27_02125 [Candidatus Omnitrophota bacterium]
MKKTTLNWLFALLFFSLFVVKSPLYGQEKKWNVYDYRPLNVGDVWTYTLHSLDAPTQNVTVEVTGQGVYNSIKVKIVKWPSEWIDYYEESSEGLKRHKDVDANNGNYGVYEPAAIQYPKYVKLNEPYRRSVIRKDYNHDSSLRKITREDLTLTLLGIEDITIPSGTHKNCLKVLADLRQFDEDDNMIKRKITSCWYALKIGIVKAGLVELKNNKILSFNTIELQSYRTNNQKAHPGSPSK